MIERLLREYLERPQRGRVVIILTLAVGFLVLWPEVDSYFALCDQTLRLRAELQEVEQAIARLEELERRNAELRQDLTKLEAACLPPERLTVFRGEVVELARQTMCRIHRIHAGESHQRPWRKGDHPLATEPLGAAPADGNYRLRTQVITLTVSGKLANVREFLGRLVGLDAMICASRFTLRPAESDPGETVLELECRLFDLGVEEPKPVSRS
jgi:hypothetical protein